LAGVFQVLVHLVEHVHASPCGFSPMKKASFEVDIHYDGRLGNVPAQHSSICQISERPAHGMIRW